MDNTLKIRVYDKGTLRNDLLGEHDVKLKLQSLLGGAESEVSRRTNSLNKFAFRVCHD
jgi:hypothetical protein